MITRDILDKYLLMEKEIKSLERSIDYYGKHQLNSVHGVVKSSKKSIPFSDGYCVVSGPEVKTSRERDEKIKQLYIDLVVNRERVEEMKTDIESWIEGIPIVDVENRLIIRMKYIDRMKDWEIAEELGYDRSTISGKIRNCIEKYCDICIEK